MTIVGIDPGTANVGYGVIQKQGDRCVLVDYGMLISTSPLLPLERLTLIYQSTRLLLERHSPETVATEKLLFSSNKSSAMQVSQAIGVILLAVAQSAAHWQEYSPVQIKQALVGYGNADKKQVQFMVQRLLGLKEPPRPDHAADALAVCICHAHSVRLSEVEVIDAPR